ncbi:MAG: methyltransferase domain-containing protein [Candidatus Pacebacteria bacterium]|nr:methyltransferase domain-containing protein [Candidatus Paceibacterota bacterium]
MKIKKAENYYWNEKEWKERTRAIARLIPACATVIDLGGGQGNLCKYLKNPIQYILIDQLELTDRTIMADFNNGEFPNAGQFQFIVCQGIVEYIIEPARFLKRIRKYGKIMIMTYREEKRDQPFRINHFSIPEIKSIIQNDWEIVFSKNVAGSHKEKLFYCIRK